MLLDRPDTDDQCLGDFPIGCAMSFTPEWFFRTSCRWAIEHPQTQQVELGPTIHLTLDELEPIDVSFGLPVAPGSLERCSNRCIVLLDAEGEIA